MSPTIKPSPYRPIAPSTAPANILPRPASIELEKRTWSNAFGDSDTSSSSTRRNSIDSMDQRVRRKEQNRAAQRAFRERKEKYVKELEDKIKELKAAHAKQIETLESENKELRKALAQHKEQVTHLPSPRDTPRLVPTPKDTPRLVPTPRPRSSAVACIRDKDGVSFCERLKEEVCTNAYAQLLTEPLFDEFGILNETVSDHPVPIVTTEKTDMFLELEQYLLEKFSSMDNVSVNSQVDLISCSEVFQRFAKHPLFDDFDKDELCDRLRQIAKCSKDGPVFDDREVQAVMEFMTMKLSNK